MNKLVAAFACITLTSATPVSAGDYEFDQSAVGRFVCNGGVGTAFHIGEGRYVTAAHVVEGCEASAPNLYINHLLDFATFTGPVLPVKIEVSCSGYRVGDMYVGVGYPQGGTYQAREPVVAVNYKPEGWQSFIGKFIPGMSGGPVINERGKVVGIVNMQWPARSQSLKNTYLCD